MLPERADHGRAKVADSQSRSGSRGLDDELKGAAYAVIDPGLRLTPH
jgi:hypothetical protein